MKHDEVTKRILKIIENKEPLKLKSTNPEDQQAISKWVAVLAAECFITGFNIAVDKVNEGLNK